MARSESIDYGHPLSVADTSLSLSKQRLVVPLWDLQAQLPGIVPWLDRLVPGVWLSPPPPRIAGGLGDLAAETRARADYAPRQGFVPWHCRALMQGWGIQCGGLPDDLHAWPPLDAYVMGDLENAARSALARDPLRRWLRDLQGEPPMSYQLATLGYALSGVTSLALWHPAGAGKTRSSLMWSLGHVAMTMAATGTAPSVIVTTPSNVVRHWERQVRKWTLLDPICWVAPSQRRKKDLAAMARLHDLIDGSSDGTTSPRIVIVSHDNIVDAWNGDGLCRLPQGVAVFDESHLFRSTKRFAASPTPEGGVEFSERKTASGERTQSNVIVEIAEWSFARALLSATPIGNKFAQLWVQLNLLRPGEWGSFYTWSARHAMGRPGEYGGWDTFGAANVEEHRARVRYFFYEVAYSETHRLLPPKRRETIYLPLSEQVSELGGWTKILATSRQEGRSRELEARLMQAASRKRKYVLTRALETIRAGQKVVIMTGRRKDVFSIFGSLVSRVMTGTTGIEGTVDESASSQSGLWWASGEVDLDERADRCDAYMRWRPEEHGGQGACLVGTADCLGIGIDLQDTDLLLVAMLPWTWDVLWQEEGRVSRIGQQRPVLIEFVIAEGTYDEHVAQTFLSKLPAIGAATPDEEVAKVGESLRGLSNMPKLLAQIFDKIAGGSNESEVEGIAED